MSQVFFTKLPGEIVSDNAQNFKSEELSTFTNRFGVIWTHVSNYYPQANSKVERVNGLLKKTLKQLDPDLDDWPFHLFQVVSAYNNATTVFDTCPAFLMFGFKSLNAFPTAAIADQVQEFMKDDPTNLKENDAIILRLNQIQTMKEQRETLFDKKHISRKARKLLNDPRSNHNAYTLGEFVYLKKLHKTSKMQPSYDGPFQISKVFSKNTYRIKDLQNRELPGTYNLIHLRPAFQHYGSPFRTIADYTTAFGDQQRNFYNRTFQSENIQPT